MQPILREIEERHYVLYLKYPVRIKSREQEISRLFTLTIELLESVETKPKCDQSIA